MRLCSLTVNMCVRGITKQRKKYEDDERRGRSESNEKDLKRIKKGGE